MTLLASNGSNSEPIGRGSKTYAGYQITENVGTQAGCVRWHEVNQNSGSGATLATPTAAGHRAYVAGTARIAWGQPFALTGEGGISFGSLTGGSATTDPTNSPLGRQTVLIVGTGIAYVLNQNASPLIELESDAKISNQVKGNTLAVGPRFTVWVDLIAFKQADPQK